MKLLLLTVTKLHGLLKSCLSFQTPEKRLKFNQPTICQQKSTHLDNFQDKRRVLEIVLEREVNLPDVLARLRVVDVHVNHRHTSIL